jgi:hypothetical protein
VTAAARTADELARIGAAEGVVSGPRSGSAPAMSARAASTKRATTLRLVPAHADDRE